MSDFVPMTEIECEEMRIAIINQCDTFTLEEKARYLQSLVHHARRGYASKASERAAPRIRKAEKSAAAQAMADDLLKELEL